MKQQKKNPFEASAVRKRIWEVDLIRSGPIFLVMLYHFCFDIYALPVVCGNYRDVIPRYPDLGDFVRFCTGIIDNPTISAVFVPLFGGTFVFVCGISSSLTRSNLRRGLLLTLAASLISVGTIILDFIFRKMGEDTDVFIGFGVLHLMAFSIMTYALIELFTRKVMKREVSALFCGIVGILIFFTGVCLNTIGYRSGDTTVLWPVRDVWGGVDAMYKEDHNFYVLSALGYYANDVDWWPIFPYTGLVYLGIGLGKLLYYPDRTSIFPKGDLRILRPLEFVGSHTMWFYLGHQPVFMAVLGLIFLAMGFRL